MTHNSEKNSRHLGNHPMVVRSNAFRNFIRIRLLERPLLKLPRSPEVLDFCCGYGFYFNINPFARGVDGDPECINHLANLGFDVKLADVTKGLPFGDGEFGYVVSHDVFEHFSKDLLYSIVIELHRVLKVGGRLIVIVPNRKGFDYGLKEGVGHVLHITQQELHDITDGYFELVKNFSFPFPRSFGQFFLHNKEYFELIKV
ncbi:MAG: class I SAM-dependent methyltransferase [Desulfuromonadaceae bacterium]